MLKPETLFASLFAQDAVRCMLHSINVSEQGMMPGILSLVTNPLVLSACCFRSPFEIFAYFFRHWAQAGVFVDQTLHTVGLSEKQKRAPLFTYTWHCIGWHTAVSLGWLKWKSCYVDRSLFDATRGGTLRFCCLYQALWVEWQSLGSVAATTTRAHTKVCAMFRWDCQM